MSLNLSRILSVGGACAVAFAASSAPAQLIDPCNPCIQAHQVVQPVVQQQCFHQVPVTEYHAVKQTVQRPVVETAYVDQPVTEYRQVMENRTAEVPTVNYQSVTECQTVHRDMGRWVTNYAVRPTMSPCEYDGRPGLLGALNRSGYQMRMAMTPKVYAQRSYCPNVVAQTIPVTRQVAIQGTKTVNYQVSRLVPYTTTRRVAVNTVKMVAQEVVTHHPVTVMKTVAVGSGLAFGSPIISAPVTSTALFPPTPATTSSALVPTPDPVSTATLPRNDAPKPINSRQSNLPQALEDGNDAFDTPRSSTAPSPLKKTSTQIRRTPSRVHESTVEEQPLRDSSADAPQVASTAPTAVRVGRWVARRPAVAPAGPALLEQGVSVADAHASRR